MNTSTVCLPPWCAPDKEYRNSGKLASALASAVRPDPELTVSQWADKYRILTGKGAAESGPYQTSRAPYLRDIMDALSSSTTHRKIVFIKSAQVGATEAGNNWLGYIVHWAPAPIMGVWPTVEMAERMSKQRIEPMLNDTPELRERIPPARSRDSGNTIRLKEFPGGVMVLTGASSASGLRSMPARYAFLDEVDAYDGDVEGEGSPIDLVARRLKTFGRKGKMFLASTPKIKGSSRIEKEFEETDQRRYHVPCPHCGHMQYLRFERLQWEKGNPDTAKYACESCDKKFEERHKTDILSRGEWRPMVDNPTNKYAIGFHISALYSPIGWESWSDIARSWEAAQGNEAQLKTFINTILGETWQEKGEAPEWQRLYERRDRVWSLGSVPEGVRFLTAGVDVQRDRIEVHVWGWGRGLESWLVDVIVLDGVTADLGHHVWSDLTATLARAWPTTAGGMLPISKAAVDTGDGLTTPIVYAWCRQQGGQQVVAIKGDKEKAAAGSPVTGPSYQDVNIRGKKFKGNNGIKLFHVTSAFFKSETYRWLRLDKPTDEDIAVGVTHPDGYVHLPDGITSEWVEQLVAEQLVSERNKRTGFSKLVWKKLRDRNEALDCRVYARAMVWLMGADRWGDTKWRRLDEAVSDAEPPRRSRAAKVKSEAEVKKIEPANDNENDAPVAKSQEKEERPKRRQRERWGAYR